MITNQLFIFILFIINGFILGSLPFGYIITKLTSSKNLMETGWKKNSSSNVMKNVGKAQGILTFSLDFAKGFFAVYLASQAGCPFYIQALCGTAAITGHNWSPFLGFKGGRGIASLAGSLFFMSPVITLLLILVCGVFTFLWTAAIGTIAAIMLGITISFADPAFYNIFLLLLFSLVPIFIKRLSPIKEIIPFEENKERIENRIIFDQDEVPAFRVKPRSNNILVDNSIRTPDSTKKKIPAKKTAVKKKVSPKTASKTETPRKVAAKRTKKV